MKTDACGHPFFLVQRFHLCYSRYEVIPWDMEIQKFF